MKRSKKVRSRGSRERRGTGPILLIAAGCRRAQPAAAARCSAARAAWRSRSSSWTLARLVRPGLEPGPVARRRRAPRRWCCRRSSARARRAARPAARASSTGATSSTRLSRLRGIRSAEPIRTRRLLAALEGVDPRVLEEAADDRDDADVLRDPRHPRAQAADAAHVEVDPDPGLRGLVERLDAAGVDQRVHLQRDPRLSPASWAATVCSISATIRSRIVVGETSTLRYSAGRP